MSEGRKAKGGARSSARLAALQALYQIEASGSPARIVAKEFVDHRIDEVIDDTPLEKADVKFFTDIVMGVHERLDEIDEQIKSNLSEDWTMERIESVARAALRAGVYEIIARVDVPTKVIINEYIDATKAFFDDGTPAFVNGVLDKVAKDKRGQGDKLTTSEFDLISKFFTPLTTEGAPAFSLKNDAAILSPNPGKDLVFTKDALVADVHFFSGDDPANIAERCLRSNLSDLAAMGAEPLGYLLSIALPKTGLDLETWLASFTKGLAANQKLFRWSLWGGDTVSTTGPITISVTAIGEVESGKTLSRDGAKEGDGIYVTGTLGDAAIAVEILKNNLECDKKGHFLKRFYKPMPRLKLGKKLLDVASSAMDISDGLIGDLSHICKHSNVGAVIYQDKIPLSPAFSSVLKTKSNYSKYSWCGGDDYELLFTVPQVNESEILNMLQCQTHSITRIGEVTASQEIILCDENGNELDIGKLGYRHFENQV